MRFDTLAQTPIQELTMAEFKSYPPGTPCWVDLSSPDLPGSKAFYGELFGWESTEGGPESGGYCMFQKQAKNVAGLGPIMGEGQPPAWMTYIAVESADATVAKITEGGGTVVVAPMDVLDAGRMAVFVDPTGAALALWQPNVHSGAELANEPGTFTWNELQTRDTDTAKSFFASVFGWGADTRQDDAMVYTEWKQGGASIGGMMDMPAEVPPQIPAYWLVYFAVDDCDASVATATRLGGAELVAPMDIEPGRFAVLSDPTGAVFGVIATKAG